MSKRGKNKGWQCPECGRCYAPWVPECRHCEGEDGDPLDKWKNDWYWHPAHFPFSKIRGYDLKQI